MRKAKSLTRPGTSAGRPVATTAPKRDVHEECEVEYKDVYPDDPSFDKLKAHPLER